MKAVLAMALSALLSILRAADAPAITYPVLYWDVKGRITDWTTRKPVANALVLVFLDDAAHMVFGTNPEQSDYPDLPRTSAQGEFVAKAVLYRGSPNKIRPDHIEVIILAPDYLTKRWRFSASKVRWVETQDTRVVELPEADLAIQRYDDIVGSMELVRDADKAKRLALLAMERRHIDASKYNLLSPESIEQITWRGRKTWRVSFGVKPPVVGGRLVLLIDARTGKTAVGFQE